MTGKPTLAQRRAQHAWQAVETARGELGSADKSEYAREAKRLPVRIMTSGLGHALSFMRAKSRDAAVRLTDDLAQWLLRERGLAGNTANHNSKALIGAIIEGDADFLRCATEEALLYLQWLSRFAEAEIKSEEEAQADD